MRFTIPRKLNHLVLKHRMLLFMCSLLVIFLFFPFIHEQYSGYFVIIELCFTLLLIMGIYIVSDNDKVLTVAILIALMAFIIIWFNMFIRSDKLLITGLILEIAFFAMTTVTIISHVLEYRKVSADKIYGAISAYFLIGIIWTLIYITLENAHPGSFSFLNTPYSSTDELFSHRFYFPSFIYYSFVTQTTLGYGDIVPLTTPARIFSAMQAVVGQLYVAVLIARLVGLHISHTHLMGRGPHR